jgi:hypothetical protein
VATTLAFCSAEPIKAKSFIILTLVKLSVTRKLNKILPNVWKKVTQNTKISTLKLHLKAQNIHIKLLLKRLNNPWVETACLGENWLCKKWPKWRNFAQLNTCFFAIFKNQFIEFLCYKLHHMSSTVDLGPTWQYFLPPDITIGPNKLECLSLAGLYILV